MLFLVLGGSGSGKSLFAEQLADRLPLPVTYIATYVEDDSDSEMTARLAAHRARRPSTWTTRVATGDLGGLVSTITGTVLIDSLGTWLAAQPEFSADGVALAEALAARRGDSVVVSDEVGMGVHPPTAAGRHFRDSLGQLNQAIASAADKAWLVVAGRPVSLDTAGL